MRLQSGHEALVARVLTEDDRVGYGFSFSLDATAARHMAEWHAGARKDKPRIEPLLAHPWETAYVAGQPVPWDCEPGFTALEFLPPRPPGSSASTH
jgi:hypothetical protein